MLQFILTNTLLISVCIILYVSVRTLPRIDEGGAVQKKGILERWIASEIPEKIDVSLNSYLFKLLRRLKIVLLKADNAVGSHLRKIKHESITEEKAPSIDFKEISSQNREENTL